MGFAAAGEGDGLGAEIAVGGGGVDADSGYARAGKEDVSSDVEEAVIQHGRTRRDGSGAEGAGADGAAECAADAP